MDLNSDNQPALVEKSTPGIRVFVYGSLKKDHCNHGLLADENSTLLGRCFVNGPYVMLDLAAYPCVINTGEKDSNKWNKVFGEVYNITQETLDSLDILEGNGRYFTRYKVFTPWKNAWMYFLPEAYLSAKTKIAPSIWQPNEQELEFWSSDGK